MTIAAGFVCHEGVLLASDTLYAGVNKRYGQKIWTIERGDLLVAFAGAGMQGGLERTRFEMERDLQPGMQVDDVIAVIQDALRTVIELMVPADNELTYGLFAIRKDGRCLLFENSGGKPMLSPVGHHSQCVGFATSLGQYFLDFLYVAQMPSRWARVVASHLIKQAKTYSEYCGGETHLLEVPHSGDVRFITDQSEIQRYESHLEQLGGAMQSVLPDGRANDDTIEHRLSVLNETIRALQKSFVIRAGGGASGSSSANAVSDLVIEGHAPTVLIKPIVPPGEKT